MSSEQVLTYTPGYRAVLNGLDVNKGYALASMDGCKTGGLSDNGSSGFRQMIEVEDYIGEIDNISICFKWAPGGGERHFELNPDITIIEVLVFKACSRGGSPVIQTRFIDNYGNIHSSCPNKAYYGTPLEHRFAFSSDILTPTEDEMLSDQVIDFIKDNNLIYNLNITSDHFKQIQALAGTGREKTIKYVIEQPREIVELKYDRNDILRDLLISFPGCDPWEKASELLALYSSILDDHMRERDDDLKTCKSCVTEKNNIEKMIVRNRDIDDPDIRAVVEMKRTKLGRIEELISDIKTRDASRQGEMRKLRQLICKLNNIPKKLCSTEFI
jgi:hypothetical protein